MLGDDESVGAESETDYSDLDVDPKAKSDSGPPSMPDDKLADGDSFDPGTTSIHSSLAANHPDGSNKSNDGIINDTQLQLSTDRPGSASPSHGSVTH
jgi:hypothetical protein